VPAIVGRDQANGDLGAASAYKVVSVGARHIWAHADVGAVVTVGRILNTSWGPRALELLAAGRLPEQVIGLLESEDDRPGQRQAALVDAAGRSAVYTGDEIGSSAEGWAGGLHRPNVAVVGHRLNDDTTLVAMIDAFEQTKGYLWDRLVAALDAGLTAGGDIRMRKHHSSALVVVRKGGGRGGFGDRIVDLRVDDHPRPVDELIRLLAIHQKLYIPTEPANLVPVTRELVRSVQARLAFDRVYEGSITGVYDSATRAAVARFAARENLEEHTRQDDKIDPRLLQRLDIRIPE
jgi:uncharacterized Ntn-hydrolase superfamily protein